MSYGTRRTKIEGGSGGKRGHSNMNHWQPTEEIKALARIGRRRDSRRQEREGARQVNETD